MNAILQEFARNFIKDGLAKLPEPNQDMFKRMYGNLDSSINDVVEAMPEDKLDWAMVQVDNTLKSVEKDENN
jgi:hypothetical protein